MGRLKWAMRMASIPTPQLLTDATDVPEHFVRAAGAASLAFVLQACCRRRQRSAQGLGLSWKNIVAVRRCRGIGKRTWFTTTHCPPSSLDPETYEVRADGAVAAMQSGIAAGAGPRLYHLF